MRLSIIRSREEGDGKGVYRRVDGGADL
jgi:hypothetical protein